MCESADSFLFVVAESGIAPWELKSEDGFERQPEQLRLERRPSMARIPRKHRCYCHMTEHLDSPEHTLSPTPPPVIDFRRQFNRNSLICHLILVFSFKNAPIMFSKCVPN